MKTLTVALSSAALLLLAGCADESGAEKTASTVPPAQAPGQLISSAPLDPALSVPDAGKALSISYLATNGVTGSGLVQVTGEVLYPDGPAPAGGWPVVAWAHGTVGIADQCAPSRNPHSARDKEYLDAWLKRGFAVVATDYQGLGGEGPHPYLNARAEAYSVLDSVRAALSSLPDLRNTVMIVGQSQGGGAAFAAAAYAPLYAPKLDIRGTVATGIPYITPQIAKTLFASGRKEGRHKGDGQGDSSWVIAYMLLMGAGQAGIDPTFDPKLAYTPKAMNAFHAASTECLVPLHDIIKADGLTQKNAFTPALPKVLAPVIRAMAYPTLKLSAPLFVGTGTADTDVAPLSQLALVKDACAAGTLVQAHLYKGKDHSETVLASLPASAVFTDAVMSGKPVTPDCTPRPQ
ncbi:lipase family protein [Acidomonas methanolica]|uniref:lipase family protein n=1 Tax=Acidomonas methanolica TaxID=437 RepID=UPI00211A7878|nr:lipase family protein [Acidomonas methanolica]MCQ9155602.1 alpha/beta hydrolase [Acidomonas methanolica]